VALDPRFRFDTFVVGSASRLAVAAAHAVSESPGAVYNPLFIYSNSGLGKTHLMGAIAHAARDRHDGLLAAYVPLDEFVEELHAAIAANTTDRLKARFQQVDLLLLDDVQLLTGRPETQTEVLRLLNAMQSAGKQIVMASDRPPSEISDVDDRLLSRLSGGLTVDIGVPDVETRIAILRAKAEDRGVRFLPGVLEALARLEFANVREMQGALNKVVAHQALGEGLVEPDRVPGILGLAPLPAPAPTVMGLGFDGFLSDMAVAVAEHVDAWRTRVAEAAGEWRAQGYRTAQLDAMLTAGDPPANWEALLRGFGALVERLRELEAHAVALDPGVEGDVRFHDPEMLQAAERLVEQLEAAASPPPGPLPDFHRANLQASPANAVAVNAADAVIAEPGARYNPLYLHGRPGAGKTHLAHAIGNALVGTTGSGLRVACVNGESFADELIDALRDGTVGRWRARYRSVDALVVDDLQRLEGKERTLEELFHLFNALAGEGKQLVFTADRPPRDLAWLDDRIRSRLEGGLVVEVARPDPAEPAAAPARTARLSMPVAAVGADSFFLDGEKVVWEWPEIGARLIEEAR
jgi:chromosomal replication initiation ATPase DnaA